MIGQPETLTEVCAQCATPLRRNFLREVMCMNSKCDWCAIVIRYEAAPPIDWKPAPEIPVGGWTPYAPPMTLRDWFAGQALTDLLTLCSNDTVSPGSWPAHVARNAYEIADAMIAERDAKP